MVLWLVCSSLDQVVWVRPVWGYCVLFLGKTLYSHAASLQMGSGKFNAGGNPAMDRPAMNPASHPGGVD